MRTAYDFSLFCINSLNENFIKCSQKLCRVEIVDGCEGTESEKRHANFAIEIVINGKIEKQIVNSGVYALWFMDAWLGHEGNEDYRRKKRKIISKFRRNRIDNTHL